MRVCKVPQDELLRTQLSDLIVVIWTIRLDDNEIDVCQENDIIDRGLDLELECFDYEPTMPENGINE